ncbi:MAG TPA: hypothetical protein VKU00_28450 [Chthonomonadaceae bacterium]|nr:hypothetical protein [Chthonomonadaceae bacterium]
MPLTSRRTPVLWRIGALALALTLSGFSTHNVRAQQEPNAEKERILFVSDRDKADDYTIYSMNPDGSDQTRISKGGGIAFDPAWSPDHKQILYSYVASREKPQSDLMVMKADGSAPTLLVPGEERTLYLSPTWSPDGKHIAYSAVQVGDGKIDIALYVMDADGKNRKKLGEGVAPTWFPDGKRLLFSPLPSAGDAPDMKSMDADGTNVKSQNVKGLGAIFSPDGKHIAFTSNGNDRPNIFVMDADGKNVTQLTKDPDTLALGPVWTKDGKHILFTRALKDVQGKPKIQVCLMDADGGNVKALTGEDSFIGAGTSLALLMRSMAH